MPAERAYLRRPLAMAAEQLCAYVGLRFEPLRTLDVRGTVN